jgi:glycosyltransferase involved in cell wall biosynthesis
LDVFIKALAVLNGKGVAFRATIGSSGDLLEYHRGLVRSLELEQIVTFSGWVDDPAPLLANSDIFVLPSLEEGSGSIALLEAMRNRLAVVASDLDGIPEVITSEVDGILVPPGDSRLLAEALERVIHDPLFRARLANAATARHASRANPEVFTEALRSLYDHILASCPGAPEERPAPGR